MLLYFDSLIIVICVFRETSILRNSWIMAAQCSKSEQVPKVNNLVFRWNVHTCLNRLDAIYYFIGVCGLSNFASLLAATFLLVLCGKKELKLTVRQSHCLNSHFFHRGGIDHCSRFIAHKNFAQK